MAAMLKGNPEAPPWLRPDSVSGDQTSLPDHFFEGQDILADGDMRDAVQDSFSAADLMCSPCLDRPDRSMPLSPAMENLQFSAPAVSTPRGHTRAAGHMLRSASKRRRSAKQSPCRLEVAHLDTDMDLQRADASCSVLGLSSSPKVDSIISPLRRSPRLHVPKLNKSSTAREEDASTGLLDSSRKQRLDLSAQHMARPGQGVMGQLAEEQRKEEQALQRLITPRKHNTELPAAPGSGRRVMQALLNEEAEQAAALDQLLSPNRLQAGPEAAPGSTSRASCGLGTAATGDARLLQEHSDVDRHHEGPTAGMHFLSSSNHSVAPSCRQMKGSTYALETVKAGTKVPLTGTAMGGLYVAGARPGSAGQLRSAASLLQTAGSGLLAAHSEKEHGRAWMATSGGAAESDGCASAAPTILMPAVTLFLKI